MSHVPDIADGGRGRQIVAVAAAGIGQALATAMAAFATRDLFAALHGTAPPERLSLWLLFGGGVLLVVGRIAERGAAEWLGHGYAIALRRALYRHLARMSVSAVESRRSGALGLRFVGDLTAARNWAGLGLTRIVSSSFVIPGAALTLWSLNPDLAAVTLPPIGGALVVMALGLLVVERLHRRLRSRRASIALAMLERVPVAPELDLMGRTDRELARLDRDGASLRRRATIRRLVHTALRNVPEVGAALAATLLLASAVSSGAAAADVAAMLAVLGILAVPLRELGGIWDRRCAWRVAHGKLRNVLETPLADARGTSVRERRRRREAHGAARLAGPSLVFRDVGFRGMTLDFALRAGETASVGGSPGSGKSSLLALAAGLETPDAGSIERGGDATPEVVFVRGTSPVLQGSLRRALTLGVSPRPDDATIEAAAERFGLTEPLRRLGGLDGRVGEGGRTLSSGERLRLHLVRAALAQPELLVLDLPDMADPTLWEDVRHLLLDNPATVLVSDARDRLADVVDRRFSMEGGGLVETAADRSTAAARPAIQSRSS